MRVPVDNLLGQEGQAFYHLVSMLPQERLSIAVTAVAHAEAAFSWTLQYCKDRHALGQLIGSFQNSRFVLVNSCAQSWMSRTFVDAQLLAVKASASCPPSRPPRRNGGALT